MADHTFDDRLAERKRKREEEKAFQEAIKQKANNPSSGLDIDLGGSTVSTTVTQTQNGVTTTASTGSGVSSSTVNLAPPGSVGYNSYSDELKEESRRFQALEKKLISEATVLEGAVYHHFNADGSFAGISQGEPLPSTLAERKAALAERQAAENAFSAEQQRDLQRVSNDPSLADEILANSEDKVKNLDKKIAQEEGTYDYNDSEPFEGGTEVPNNAPDIKIKYPYNWVQTTSAGHMFEMNNTEDGEYIRLLNANGNFLNIDEKKNNNLVSYNDTYILSDHNLVIRVGKDVNNDRMALHIVGDVNLYVEGNMHSEVEGDRFDRVNGNYQMQVGGVATIQSDENLAIQAKNEMKLQSNAYTNKTVFLENDLSEGGSIKENVRGNYEVKILKSSAAYSVVSNGDIRSRASGCRYEYTFGNHLSKVIGKLRMRVDGASQSCIKGGGFPGMFDEPDNATYRLNVGGDIDIDASGIVDIDGTEIYLN